MKRIKTLIYTPLILLGVYTLLLTATVLTKKIDLGGLILSIMLIPISYAAINFYIRINNIREVNTIKKIPNTQDYFYTSQEHDDFKYNLMKIQNKINQNSKIYFVLGLIQTITFVVLINLGKLEIESVPGLILTLFATIIFIGTATTNIILFFINISKHSKKIQEYNKLFNINENIEQIESKISFKTLLAATSIFIIYLLVSKTGLAGQIIFTTLKNLNVDPKQVNVVAQILYQLLLLILILLPAVYLIKSENKNSQPKYYLVLYFFGISFLTTLIFVTINNFIFPPTESLNEAALNSIKVGNEFIFFILVVIMAPIVEELVFRKGLAEALYSFIRIVIKPRDIKYHAKIKLFASVVAILISATLFAFIHTGWEDINNFLSYFGGALILSTSYFVSGRRIIVPILLHMLNNALAF
jgi:membrane protease YdiL (CAAX protease family)